MPTPRKNAKVCRIPVDLRKCKPGDKLKSRDGNMLKYVGLNPMTHTRYHHQVLYGNGAYGTRQHDGMTWGDGEHPYDIVATLSGPGATVAKSPAPRAKREKAARPVRSWTGWAHACKDGSVWVINGSREEARSLACEGDQVIRVEIKEIREVRK